MKNTLILLFCTLVAACNAERDQEEIQSMFSKQKSEQYVIASPLEGILLRDGKPSPNTTIIRRLTWNGNDEGLSEEFTTDTDGYFSIPAYETELKLGILDQFVSKSKLYVDAETDENLIWYSPKFSPEIYSETDAPLKELVCDPNSPKRVINMQSWNILTKCTWRDMPE